MTNTSTNLKNTRADLQEVNRGQRPLFLTIMSMDMKVFILTILFLGCFSAKAETLPLVDPIHTSKHVLSALYEQAKINPSEVKVIIFEFNYIKGFWHIELTPANQTCIDCFPAFYFQNSEKLILQKIPHG